MTRKKLSLDTRANTKSLLTQGKSVREISKRLGVGIGSVSNISKAIGIKKKNKTGRPRKLTDRDVSFCVREITSDRSPTASAVSKTLKNKFNIQVSPDTIARALKKKGMKPGEKKKKPLLSKKNVKARLEFAKEHADWTEDDWSRVIFSDETKINRFNSDGRSWCWFRDPNELTSRVVKQSVKHGGGGVMVWGCITSQGVGYCCKIDNILDQYLYKNILEDELMKTIEYYEFEPKKVIFQHDNDPKHTAKSVKEWIQNQEFKTMVWPAQSPDLNPIENLWSQLKRRLNKYDSPPKGINELWERIQETWNNIQPETCLNLINSMPARISSVIKSKGRWTKY
jgi:transposase